MDTDRMSRSVPSRWWYVLGAILPPLGFIVSFYGYIGIWLSGVPIEDLTRVVVPGESRLWLEDTPHSIYYESRSVVDDTTFDTGDVPSGLSCTLIHEPTGAHVALQRRTGGKYALGITGGPTLYEGASQFRFFIRESGHHILACTHDELDQKGSIVMAVRQHEPRSTFIRSAPWLFTIAGLALVIGAYRRRERALHS